MAALLCSGPGKGSGFTAGFPTIARACEKLLPTTRIDAEVIVLDENGRCAFNALQRKRPNGTANGGRYRQSARDHCMSRISAAGAWLKYKINKSQEFVIGGYTLGRQPVRCADRRLL